jgi:hypothetical protein
MTPSLVKWCMSMSEKAPKSSRYYSIWVAFFDPNSNDFINFRVLFQALHLGNERLMSMRHTSLLATTIFLSSVASSKEQYLCILFAKSKVVSLGLIIACTRLAHCVPHTTRNCLSQLIPLNQFALMILKRPKLRYSRGNRQGMAVPHMI